MIHDAGTQKTIKLVCRKRPGSLKLHVRSLATVLKRPHISSLADGSSWAYLSALITKMPDKSEEASRWFWSFKLPAAIQAFSTEAPDHMEQRRSNLPVPCLTSPLTESTSTIKVWLSYASKFWSHYSATDTWNITWYLKKGCDHNKTKNMACWGPGSRWKPLELWGTWGEI